MPRQTASDGRVYTTIRLDPELVRRMDDEAKCRVVSRTFLIEKALDAWLAENEGAA